MGRNPDLTTSGTTSTLDVFSVIDEYKALKLKKDISMESTKSFSELVQQSTTEMSMSTATTSTSGLTFEQLNRLMRTVDARIDERLEEHRKLLHRYIKTIVEEGVTNFFGDAQSNGEGVSVVTDRELEWASSHSKALAEYQGQYVAIFDGKVVGSGETLAETRRSAKANAPNASPLIMQISDSDFGL